MSPSRSTCSAARATPRIYHPTSSGETVKWHQNRVWHQVLGGVWGYPFAAQAVSGVYAVCPGPAVVRPSVPAQTHRHDPPEHLIGELLLPTPRDNAAATAASTYGLLVLQSTSAFAATARSLSPSPAPQHLTNLSHTPPEHHPGQPPAARLGRSHRDEAGPTTRHAGDPTTGDRGWSQAHGGNASTLSHDAGE